MVLIIKYPISQYIGHFKPFKAYNSIVIFLIYIRYEKIPRFHGITGILPITTHDFRIGTLGVEMQSILHIATWIIPPNHHITGIEP